jgi:hypothetical protein
LPPFTDSNQAMDGYGDEIDSCFFENTLAIYESSHHPNRSANLSFHRLHVPAQVVPPSAPQALIAYRCRSASEHRQQSGEQAMAKMACTGCVSS